MITSFKIFLTSLTGLSAIAFAGGVASSGGGSAVVCRLHGQAMHSAELLDLWEVKHRGVELIASSGSFLEDYRRLNSRVDLATDRRTPPIDEEEFRRMLSEDFLFVEEKLPQVHDVGRTAFEPTVPQFQDIICQLEQVAIFGADYPGTENGVSVINKKIWQFLDPLNKAALLAHETFYYRNKRWGRENTSETARRIVGRFFSNTTIEPRIRGKEDINLSCQSRAPFGNSSRWYVTETESGSTIQFEELFGREIYFNISIPVPNRLSRENFKNLSFGPLPTPDSFLQYTGKSFGGKFEIASEIYPGYKIGIHFGNSKIVKLSLFDSTDTLVNAEYGTDCFER